MARKKTNPVIKKLKKERWSFWKASQYRSSWRDRCKKSKGDVEDVPTRQEIQDWLEAQVPYKCYLTQDTLDKNTLQADHMEPLSRGGSFRLDNIGLTSKRFNQVKGEMSVPEFLQLLEITKRWEDKGDSLFRRLMAGTFIYKRRRKR